MRTRVILIVALLLVTVLVSASGAHAATAVWRTFGQASATGHLHWGPEVRTGSQTDPNPVAVRMMIDGTPFTQPGRIVDVTWNMDCFDDSDFMGTLVHAEGNFTWSGAFPKAKTLSTIGGNPIADYSYCQLTVDIVRQDSGDVSVKVQARYS